MKLPTRVFVKSERKASAMRHSLSARRRGPRLDLLSALAVAAFLLVPAQAFAANNAFVEIEGSGSGELVPIPGEEEIGGSPAIGCEYTAPGPATGTCATVAAEEVPFHFLGVKAVPAPGSVLVEWEVVNGAAVTNRCEATNPANQEDLCSVYSFGTELKVKAVFALAKVHITIEGSGSGEVVGSGLTAGKPKVECAWNGETEEQTGACDVAAGKELGYEGIKVTHEAAGGSEFAGWAFEEGTNIGGCSEPLGYYCGLLIVNPGEEIKITATFEPEPSPEPHTLTVEGSAEGRVQTTEDHAINCGTRCSAEYEEGAEVELVAHSAEGAVFTEWSGGDCDESTSRFCTVTMDENETVKAEYASAVTLTVENPGGGRVQTTGGHAINCGTRCSADYEVGASPELVAQPSSGFQFKEWEGGDCDESTSRFCSLSMSGSQTTKAVFAATVSLTVEKEGSGRVQTLENHAINCGTRCVAFYEAAAEPDVELVAQAAEGGTFVEWTSGPCAGETSRFCTVTMDGNKTAKAKFNP
jgi:hypothetical protein